MDGKKNEAAKLLLKSWEKIIRNILLPKYVAQLTKEIITRKKKTVFIILCKFSKFKIKHINKMMNNVGSKMLLKIKIVKIFSSS